MKLLVAATLSLMLVLTLVNVESSPVANDKISDGFSSGNLGRMKRGIAEALAKNEITDSFDSGTLGRMKRGINAVADSDGLDDGKSDRMKRGISDLDGLDDRMPDRVKRGISKSVLPGDVIQPYDPNQR